MFAPEKPEESLSAADAEPGKEKEHVYSVTELCRNLDQQLSAFGHFRVEAEISGFKRYSSGHWYFTLKDDQARTKLLPTAFQLLGQEDRIRQIERNVARLAKPDAAQTIVDEVYKLV